MRKVISSIAALLMFSSVALAQPLFTGGRTSKLNITAATVVKVGSGRLATFTVTTAGAAGTISDTTTTGAVAAANLIAVTPATVGVYKIDWPVLNGIVVTPGVGQIVSVSYE
jgi:hypothetical protein